MLNHLQRICQHGKPIPGGCPACEKGFGSEDRLRAMNAELLVALRSARLMLYAWKGARARAGMPDDHDELDDTILQVERAIAKTTTKAKGDQP